MAAKTVKLRVDPAVMFDVAQSLSEAAECLQKRLGELDDRVGDMLGGRQGPAESAYPATWQRWHQGAAEVELALSIMARLVGQAVGGLRACRHCIGRDATAVGDG